MTGLLFLVYDQWLVFLDFLNPVFGDLYVFFATYLLCMGLAAAALIRGRPSAPARVYLSLAVLVGMAFPLLLPVLYEQYEPYARPAPGFEMHWITQPGDTFISAFKQAQRAHDKTGCSYRLYGWDADNVLYYGSDCLAGFLQYQPAGDTESRPVSRIPGALEDRSTVLGAPRFGMDTPGYPGKPEGFDPSTVDAFIAYESVRSPDGQWVAVAIQNWYGPRDVVILGAE